jgi:hypothetical protein
MTKLANSTDCSRRRIIAYRVTTVVIAAEFAVGGVMDVLQLPPFFAILKHLGYPGYFSVILGVRKGARCGGGTRPALSPAQGVGLRHVLQHDGSGRLHLPVGDPPVALVAPIIFTGLVVASWAMRPLARRDDPAGSAASSFSAASHDAS